MNILTAKGISKTFTDRKLLEEADFSLEDTDKVGIVGINGTSRRHRTRRSMDLKSGMRLSF